MGRLLVWIPLAMSVTGSAGDMGSSVAPVMKGPVVEPVVEAPAVEPAVEAHEPLCTCRRAVLIGLAKMSRCIEGEPCLVPNAVVECLFSDPPTIRDAGLLGPGCTLGATHPLPPRLYGMRGWFHQLGLRSGDVLLSLNDVSLAVEADEDRFARREAVWREATSTGRVSVELLRRGERRRLEWTMEPAERIVCDWTADP